MQWLTNGGTMTCKMCEAYKAKMRKSDAKIVQQQAQIRRLKRQIEELGQTETGKAKTNDVSTEDGLDFFEAYTGLQLQRMKYK